MKKKSLAFLGSCLVLAVLTLRAEDPAFFPPASEAKAFDDFDNNGFIINGERTFIASGSIHYARVPREFWRDRLLRLKRGGFNNVQTYAFWNFHEARENQWNFSGDRDFSAFLQTAQDVGLTATVRVGPYVCAEWDSGGYPLWLKFKPTFNVRSDNPTYNALQDQWLSKILSIVTPHQINHGGNVILVQLENEGGRWGAWTGTISDSYYTRLHDTAITDGVQVPFLMSGTHHGFSPTPDNPDSATRGGPWYSTETWTGWYDLYGSYGEGAETSFMSKALAYGASGFNYYMAHGGTNFDSWNDNEVASSYDYAAAIGQTGDLRPIYYTMKRYNTFATSFSNILADATGDLPTYANFASNGRVLSARKSPNGTIVFVQGLVSSDDPITLQGMGNGAGGSIHLAPREIAGIVLDAPLVSGASNIRIIEAVSKIFGVAHNGSTTTLVLYGKPGDTGVLTLGLGDTKKKIEISYPEGQPNETFEKAGDQTLRILSMSDALADLTWMVGAKGRQSVVVGPEYISDLTMSGGKPLAMIERYFGHDAPSKVIVYGAAGQPDAYLAVHADTSSDDMPAPDLGAWQMSSGPVEARPNYNDSAWRASDKPEQMGADGDTSAFAWYRTVLPSSGAGPATLHFAGAQEHILVFVNGQQVPATSGNPEPTSEGPEFTHGELIWDVPVSLKAGTNSLAVFVSHAGRAKAFAYYGPLDNYFPKGITKPVTLTANGQTTEITGWKMHGGLAPVSSLPFRNIDPAYAPSGPQFFKTTFQAKPLPPGKPGLDRILRVTTSGLSRGTIFLNGHNLGRYPEVVKIDRKDPLWIWLPECWLKPDGNNSLVVFDEEGQVPSQVKLVVEKNVSREVIAATNPAAADAPLTFTTIKHVNFRSESKIDPATDKPVTASSSAPTHEPFLINDGDEASYWQPAETPSSAKPATVQIDLGSAQSFHALEIGWTDSISKVSYLVEGSSDGSAWQILADKRDRPDDKKDQWVTLPVPAGTTARYVRLTITGVHDISNIGVNTLRLLQ